jgi:hypothetical protein
MSSTKFFDGRRIRGKCIEKGRNEGRKGGNEERICLLSIKHFCPVKPQAELQGKS